LKKNSSECSSNRNTIESSEIGSVQQVKPNEFNDTATGSSNAGFSREDTSVVDVYRFSNGKITRSHVNVSDLKPDSLREIDWAPPADVALKVCPYVY
jgi:hypothetical protein